MKAGPKSAVDPSELPWRRAENGIPTACTLCGAQLLNPHELTGLCRECKLVLRNERLSQTEASGNENSELEKGNGHNGDK